MVSHSVLCHYKQQSPQAHKLIGWEGYNQNYNSSSAFRLYFRFHNYHSQSPNACAYRDGPVGLYTTLYLKRGVRKKIMKANSIFNLPKTIKVNADRFDNPRRESKFCQLNISENSASVLF